MYMNIISIYGHCFRFIISLSVGKSSVTIIHDTDLCRIEAHAYLWSAICSQWHETWKRVTKPTAEQTPGGSNYGLWECQTCSKRNPQPKGGNGCSGTTLLKDHTFLYFGVLGRSPGNQYLNMKCSTSFVDALMSSLVMLYVLFWCRNGPHNIAQLHIGHPSYGTPLAKQF